MANNCVEPGLVDKSSALPDYRPNTKLQANSSSCNHFPFLWYRKCYPSCWGNSIWWKGDYRCTCMHVHACANTFFFCLKLQNMTKELWQFGEEEEEQRRTILPVRFLCNCMVCRAKWFYPIQLGQFTWGWWKETALSSNWMIHQGRGL